MESGFGKRIWTWLVHTKLYIQALAKRLLLAAVTGTC